jgi:hypothetical protein
LPASRDQTEDKAWAALKADSIAIYGYAWSLAFESEMTFALGSIVGVGSASVIVEALGVAGAITAGLAGAAFIPLATLAALAYVVEENQIGDVSRGIDAVGMATSPGTLLSLPFSSGFSPPGNPSLFSNVWGPRFDLGLGLLSAGTPVEVELAGMGGFTTMTQPGYQNDEAELQNWQTSLTNGSVGSPAGSPSPAPGPTPLPSPTSGPIPISQQGYGPSGFAFSYDGMTLGIGDFGFQSDEASSSSSSFNGNGFNMTMSVGGSGASEAPAEPPPFNDAPTFDDGSPFNDSPPFDNHPFDNGFDNFDNSFDNFDNHDNSFDNFDDEE